MLIDHTTKPKIIAIGDSITKGYPDDYSWVTICSRKLDNQIENLGLNGDTFAGIEMRLEKDVISKEPDFCIITAGTNDVFLGYDIEEIKKTIKLIIITLEKEGVIPVITTPIPTVDEYVDKKLEDLRRWIYAVCPHTISFHKAFEDESILSGSMLSDGVHPTHEGHNRLADIAVHEIRKLIIETSR